MARPTFKDKLRKRKDLTPFIHNFVDTKSAASRKVFQSVMYEFNSIFLDLFWQWHNRSLSRMAYQEGKKSKVGPRTLVFLHSFTMQILIKVGKV